MDDSQPLSDDSQPLSDAPPDYNNDSLSTLRLYAQTELDGYAPRNANDNTKVILEAFIKELPDDGARNICEDIVNCVLKSTLVSEAHDKFHELAKHLWDAVVAPSESSASISCL